MKQDCINLNGEKRPKSRLPDGRINPKYTQWYRGTVGGIQATKKYSKKQMKLVGVYQKRVNMETARIAKRLRYPWSAEEEWDLLEKAEHMTAKELALHFKRSISGIRGKLHILRREDGNE